MSDSEYVCTLSDASLEVAIKELNEDPKERESQVETLRTWVLQQKHMACPTDTKFLIKFLRTAKFSQLKAREILENHLKVITENPDWFRDLDTTDPDTLAFYATGYILPLPKRDPKGRFIILTDMEKFDPDPKKWNLLKILRAVCLFNYYTTYKEDDLVNGMVFFEDMSHFSHKQMTFWGLENSKKMTKLWQGNFPGRFKEFHYYNCGPVFDTLMAIMMPLLSKKWRDRMVIHGVNMERVYKHIPMEYLPDEYLSDDYTGPSAGPTSEIIEKFLAELRAPEFRDRVLYETSSRWKYDKNQKETDIPVASFRKLNVE